jgi:hypothetical protein
MRTFWLRSVMVAATLGSVACGPRSGPKLSRAPVAIQPAAAPVGGPVRRAYRPEQEWIALTGLALTALLGGLRLINSAGPRPTFVPVHTRRIRRRPPDRNEGRSA